MAILVAAVVCFTGGASRAAAPPGWDNVPVTATEMFLLVNLTLDNVSVPIDNNSLLAVFAENIVDRPVSVITLDQAFAGSTPGSYVLPVYGTDNVGGIAAGDNALLTFAFYNAETGAVLTMPVVRNHGDIYGVPLPYADNTTTVRYVPGLFLLPGAAPLPSDVIDNVTLAFTTPPSGADRHHRNFFEKAFGCSAAGGRGPEPLEGAFGLLIMLGPAWILLRIQRRRRHGDVG
jgi:hypothetical protein